jgi:pimeloyl-ACP methyl ester carboxylesterase
MTTMALVHGAFHGAWCWDHLRPELEARGFAVVVPDLPCDDPRPRAVLPMSTWW